MCKIPWYRSGFQAFNNLLGIFYNLANGTFSWGLFQTIFIYIYINCLNSFWENDKVKIRIKAKTSLESRFEEPKIEEPNIFGALIIWVIALLRVKNSSNLLEIIESYWKFLQ